MSNQFQINSPTIREEIPEEMGLLGNCLLIPPNSEVKEKKDSTKNRGVRETNEDHEARKKVYDEVRDQLPKEVAKYTL
ncbi:9622_t:CDS:2 [Ambispora leptoticha]|uniref:9622_t:CDS:1 n=1 Tax=Ambispora leptoticha TaxID=144679 RepID=A0A9N9AIN2_9GLOM|nr:9622_t:CDS:2 [Ambispora leptoticha]